MSGKVVHFEIPYDDGDRARRFYREAFDWQLSEMPGMECAGVVSGPSSASGPSEPGFINGGMLAREEAAAPGPVVVMDVPSIDECLVVIERLGGGTVLPKPPGGGGGL